ncbi:MAG: bifunctional diaminohydroxyphosphoribosylaminopyrimidine deaminase/5-amino-6-(5-phosphoribosylamino)uracil reductase RibD [Eubacteriales bacterium]|nr:bifunctional diaminohydroxyphosphoribosylaminopyrimidine deaminase/5-amino-6-(5-phosphoribosylamino)uracil reductase RibD [Eubacteriales bacterium]
MAREKDIEYMKRAVALAKKGIGWVNPNPLVGAVIVKDNRIIGEGYHRKYGELHAERDALRNCTHSPKGATIYVTLEPCCHHGKQPPCTEALVEAGIKRVVMGSLDPNPLVSGKGVSYLREHGIEVEEELVCNKECLDMNYVFFHYIKNKEPYIIMKYAQTLDGKIATYKGLSQWITGSDARQKVHEDRHRYAAIMVGIGTVIKDNPSLTCRCDTIDNRNNPARIVCDSKLRIPMDSKLVTTARTTQRLSQMLDKREDVSEYAPTIIATCSDDEDKKQQLEKAGCEVITTSSLNGSVNLRELANILGQKGIDSIILEGGATLNWSALESGIVNRVQAYISPKIFGGETAKTPVAGQGVAAPADAYILKNRTITVYGDDILIEGELDGR